MKTGKIMLSLFALVFSFCIFSISAYASEEIGKGVVTASVLNIRKAPSTSSEIIGKLYKGNVVSILGTDSGFYEISLDSGNTAYISTSYCEIRKNSTVSRSSSETRTAKGEQVVNYSEKFLGVRYSHGGTSPSGFDCSGFTYYVYKNFGVTLNRSSSAQYRNGTRVSKSELRAGDLVFFKNGGSSIGHVGIYVGDGKMIHSPSPGKSVKYDTIESGYYSKNYVGATRIF